MSLHRLSAGAGYRYLIRHTACGDAHRDPATPLTAYYTDSGYPPGRWIGSGLNGLAAGTGLPDGTTVTEEALARLFAHGHDPTTGSKLGRAYPSFHSPDDRAAARIASLPPSLTREQRETVTAQIQAHERSRTTPAAVAGFDLTFTIPKSASILWALGDPVVQTAVAEAHARAVADAISFLETHALYTRTGASGIAQVHTRGAVAAAFDHWDTRTGDPNLHTHVVLANKVQGEDGAWRAMDSRALYQATVAISEIYDDLFADHLHTRLPRAWEWRDRGPRRSPAYELTEIDDRLIREFSTRSVTITEGVRTAIGDFTRRRGHAPSRAEVLRVRQQVTRSTRPAKTVRRLADELADWRDRAAKLPTIPRHTVNDPAPAITADALSPETISRLAATVLENVQQRRSTWTRWNVLAETARTCRAIRTLNAAERHRLHEKVTDTALAACIDLAVRDAFTAPDAYRRPDAESVFTRHHEARHTSRTILDAEARLLAAHQDLTAPVADVHIAGDEEQAVAVRTLVTSGRRVDVLVGAAGTGKTRTLQRFRGAWERVHGPESVIGLAPSATAARELADALGIGCENTAKWLHESAGPCPDRRWQMRSGQAVIVDEASLAGTLALDRITAQAQAAGAKVLLVGDPRQLDAVEAGGALGLLATWGQPVELTGLWRFRQKWEAEATRSLREGDPACLDTYDHHARLHHAPFEVAIDNAYGAARTAEANGRTALLVALDTATVDALNARARADRVADGIAAPGGIELRDRAIVGTGDRIVTRRNNRRISYGHGDFVRNGNLWDIAAVHTDGSLDARPASCPASTEVVRLPGAYVREHVELGYASTLHRAQGMTVDSAHVIVTASVTREALYVGMTRGREENHSYLATDTAPDAGSDPIPDAETDPRVAMESILNRSGAELSATQTLADARVAALSPQRLGPVTATVLADAATKWWIAMLPTLGYPPETITRINASYARGPLITKLQNGALTGHDMTGLMRQLASQLPKDPDGDPAEYLHDRVHRWLNQHETADQALSPERLRELQIEHGIRTSDPETTHLLEQLQAAGRRHLAGTESSGDRQDWLPPLRTASADRPAATGRHAEADPPTRSPQP